MFPYSLIVAEEKHTHGIGKGGVIPWTIPEDLKHFKKVTTREKNSVVIMGRKTWESLPPGSRPLAGRINFVLSSTLKDRGNDSFYVVASVNDVWKKLTDLMVNQKIILGSIFIIGGSRLFNEYAENPWCQSIYLTEIESMVQGGFRCDTFWKGVPESLYRLEKKIKFFEKEGHIGQGHPKIYVTITLWSKKRVVEHPEKQYLDLVEKVLNEGTQRTDRTGVGTLSIFGAQMRFDLSLGFPLFTTKNVFWKGVRDELLWFIAGETSSKTLAQKGVHIWDANGTRDFLDKRGLNEHAEGDLGPCYGFQWRHFGAQYEGPISSDQPNRYAGKGVDQLRECIDLIKHDPDSRRIILSAWNPVDLKKIAVPPCHILCQFYVSNGRLSCQLYQRSADLMLGVPFNVASYALLTTMIAQCCNLQVGDFVHSIGDAHIYSNHLEGAREQIRRKPLPFPVVQLNPEKKDIDDFISSDIKLCDYFCHPTIKFQMAI